MRYRSRVTLVAASVPVAFFAVLAACSNADNTNPDSGTDATADTNQKADVVVADVGATDGNTDTGVDAGASCDAANLGCPAVITLHPPATDAGQQTVYCPRSGTDGGKTNYCAPQSEHCCEGQTAGSCVPTLTACAPSDIDWQCADPISDCAGGHACCGRGILATGLGSGCGNSALCFTGTYCSTGATCASGEIEMCTSNTECSGGSCTPFTIDNNQVGACH
jgi:hypothetical protein